MNAERFPSTLQVLRRRMSVFGQMPVVGGGGIINRNFHVEEISTTM